MNWKQFLVFAIVVLVINWFISWISPTLQSIFGGWGIIGTIILFLIPMYVLYWALKRFVFKRS